MSPLLIGILAAVLGLVVFFYYAIFGKSFMRVLVELAIGVGLAFLFKWLGWSSFMAYLAAGITIVLLFFIKAG